MDNDTQLMLFLWSIVGVNVIAPIVAKWPWQTLRFIRRLPGRLYWILVIVPIVKPLVAIGTVVDLGIQRVFGVGVYAVDWVLRLAISNRANSQRRRLESAKEALQMLEQQLMEARRENAQLKERAQRQVKQQGRIEQEVRQDASTLGLTSEHAIQSEIELRLHRLSQDWHLAEAA